MSICMQSSNFFTKKMTKIRQYFTLHPLWRYLNIFPLALRNYVFDRCQSHSSALTLYTLLGFVPILALIFGVAQGFGVKDILQKQIIAQVPQQEVILQKIFSFAQNLLERTRSGVMISIGLGLLLWSLISILWQIESVFNHIWQLKKNRNFTKMLTDYLSAMVILPVLFVASSGVNIFLSAQITKLSAHSYVGKIFDSALSIPVKIAPYLIIWLLFSFLYVYMPNKKVKIRYAIVAGVIAGSLYQLTQFFYLWLQIGLSSYNAIYGSFAAIPLFLIWIRTSWMIILYGAEFFFVLENYNIYYGGSVHRAISFRQTFVLARKIIILITKNFEELKGETSLEFLSKKLRMQKVLVMRIVEQLVQLGILVELETDKRDESFYTLAMPREKLTNKLLFEKLASNGENRLIAV